MNFGLESNEQHIFNVNNYWEDFNYEPVKISTR